jgi:hypothetical protein
VKKERPHILLVNPWIHDFAAYDFWAKPLGLLTLAAILRCHGFSISYIDCTDRFHPKAPPSDSGARMGRGPYPKSPIPKPAGLEKIPRTYSRYGIEPAWFRQDLTACGRPDLILVTSLMTYWYPGVQETIAAIREIHGETPVVLGGIYASLCMHHAERVCGADEVLPGAGEGQILALAGRYTGLKTTPRFMEQDLDSLPYPAFDLLPRLAYIPLLTSRGCPFDCAYCAAKFLMPRRRTRTPQNVVAEITHWHRSRGVIDFAFYDDALLADPEKHALPMLEMIIRHGLPVRFHTPNALHIGEISKASADLMFRAGFKTIRLGLETAAFDKRAKLDRKVTASQFQEAVEHLKQAGFERNQIGAYLLTGLPGQRLGSVAASIQTVNKVGITPILAHYSPIPHTRLWDQAVVASRFDIAADPVFTNNALLPCRREDFSWAELSRLKQLIKA